MTRGQWKYEPGPFRRKHKWDEEFAGFEEQSDGRKIGKCPASMSSEDAEKLLNEGVDGTADASDQADLEWPENIYTVDENGTIYRAVPTQLGESYHGFPASDERRIPREVKNQILDLAESKNCEQEAKRWMRRYMNVPSL